MRKNYALLTDTPKPHHSNFRFSLRRLTSLLLVLFVSLGAFANDDDDDDDDDDDGNYGGHKKSLVVSACKEDLGNGMIKITFGYNNPTNKVITVNPNKSYVLLVPKGNKGKKGKKNKKKNKAEKMPALTTFQPGLVEEAFSVVINKNATAKWMVKNKGKNTHAKGSNKSSICTFKDPPIIFPVYGQGDGKSDDPVGLELTALSDGNAGDEPSEIIYQINSDLEVLVEIIPTEGNLLQVINLLQTTFGLQYNADPMFTDFVVDPAMLLAEEFATIDVFFPIDRITELNDFANIVNFVRPLYTPILEVGVVDSQGDAAQLSNLVRDAYRTVSNDEVVPVNGEGIKVGVISDSYDRQPFVNKTKATVDVEQGDLPGIGNPNGFTIPVDVQKDYPYGNASDEGRAMLQIIHDVAPGAELAFNTGVLSPRDMALAINNLSLAGCNLITDDITYPLEPFFGEGQLAEAIKNFTSIAGNAYFTSSGNFSNDGYQSQFNPSSAAPVTNFLPADSPARAHLFDAATQDDKQKISVVPGTYMLVLQWDEGLASQENSEGAVTDLDFYLVDDDGNLIVGNNRMNEAGDPSEVMVFQATGTGEANILITSAGGPPPPGLAFRYIAFRSQGLEFLEYGSGAPTVSGHAMTPEVIAVGAVDYRIAQSPSSEDFSSFAGVLPNNTTLNVDISAPDGVNTNVDSIGQDVDSDGFPNFFGTSASAPHAAGAFALLMSALPSWYPNGLGDIVTPTTNFTNPLADQVLQLFKNTAVPAGSVEQAGAGLINVSAAFNTIAAQTANLTSLIIEPGKTPSEEPFEVTILGEFLPENPTVIFDGMELEIISQSDTEITALVGVFTGNPPLIINTPPITPGGTDGGDSDPIFFFEGDKIALSIMADNATIEFGQSVTFTSTIEGLPDGETLESLGLPAVVFASPAVFPFPDVNNYAIVPSFGDVVLTQEQLDNFQINFLNGLLTVNKKDLSIQPQDETIQYGDALDLSLDYIYDTTGIDDNTAFLNAIMSAHESDFFTDNTLIVINKLRAVVNEQEILNLLNNGSWMTSERIIQNKLRAVVNGMNLIDLDVQNFNDYLNAVIDPTTNKLRAVVNKLRAVVNGQDLLDNNIDLVIENKLRPVVNDTGLGDENDGNDYGSIFAVIDAEDGSTETEDRTIDQLYAMGLLTGLDITTSPEDRQYSFPGAFLSPIAANFNINYESGRVTILPAVLHVTTSDLEINEGDPIDTSLINTVVSGYVYDDTQEILFPDGFEYIFKDADGNEYVDGDVGEFFIKIKSPDNYILGESDYGKLIVNFIEFKCERVTNLNFSSTPVLEEGVGYEEGAVYRFANVTNDLDALVTVMDIMNGRIDILDQNSVDPSFFKPEIEFTVTNSVRNPYVDLHISLVHTGTNNPAVLPELIASFVDIDGNDIFQEINRFSTPARYIVDDPTEIAVTETAEGILINGSSTEYAGITNQNPQVNISAGFTDISSFVFRFGIDVPGAQNFVTPPRQSGIQFSCLENFVNPQTTILSEGGNTGSDDPYVGVVYPNPVQNILNVQVDEDASGNIEVIDIYGQQFFSFNFNSSTPKPVQIDMTSYAEGVYFVRITIGGVSEVYTVLKDN